jgi:hypothetical protein
MRLPDAKLALTSKADFSRNIESTILEVFSLLKFFYIV